MRRFLNNLAARFRVFMQGRYGVDEFSRFLTITALVLMLASGFGVLWFLYPIGAVLVIYALFRTLSKNTRKRLEERTKYLLISGKVKKRFALWKCMWRDRKTHRYYTCPACREKVRITKPGKWKTITITCAHCGRKFDVKT